MRGLIYIWSYLIIVSLSIIYVYFNKSSEKYAYVNSVKLLNEYQGMIDARNQLQITINNLKTNIDTLNSEFQISLTQHEKEISKMTKKEIELSEKLLKNKQEKLINYQKVVQQKIKDEEIKTTENVISNINTFLENYGKKNGYTLIFGANESGNIVYAEKEIDITDKVLLELNGNYVKKGN